MKTSITITEELFKTFKEKNNFNEFKDFEDFVDCFIFKYSPMYVADLINSVSNDMQIEKLSSEENISVLVSEELYNKLVEKQNKIIKLNKEKFNEDIKKILNEYTIVEAFYKRQVLVSNTKNNDINERFIYKIESPYPMCQLKHNDCGFITIHKDIRKLLSKPNKKGFCGLCRNKKK